MNEETDYSVTYKAIANRLKEIRKAKGYKKLRTHCFYWGLSEVTILSGHPPLSPFKGGKRDSLL